MTLKEIAKQWLEQNEYDGLVNIDAPCGCGVDDFMPCGEPSELCEAGHEENAPEGSEFDVWIVPGKKK